MIVDAMRQRRGLISHFSTNSASYINDVIPGATSMSAINTARADVDGLKVFYREAGLSR
jgi:hypothetical protein